MKSLGRGLGALLASFWISLPAQEVPLGPRVAPAPAGAAAEPQPPEAPPLASRITAVTLYSDQALVVRSGSVSLPAGRSKWEASGLPAALGDGSVRARVLTAGAGRLANLEVLTRNRTVFRKKEAEEADAKLKEIQARHKGAADELAALEREAAILQGFEVGKKPDGRPEKPSPAPIDVASWRATLDFVDGALVENRRRARELLVAMDGIEEELAVAAALAEKLASAQVHVEKSVLLELEAAAPAAVEVELAYLVPGPGWWPRYDIRADVDTGKLELLSYALVRQETGEDWQDVTLTFSAAEPARAADLPELLAWHIGESRTPQAPPPTSLARVPSAASSSVPLADVTGQAAESMHNFDPAIEPQLAQNVQNANRLLAQSGQQQAKLPASRAAQTRVVLGRLKQQLAENDAAAQRKDWSAFVEGNFAAQEEISNLDVRYRAYFQDVLAGCQADITKGERLLKTARLADGIVPPVQSSRGYDYKYQALRRETVPSDGAFNKVVIGVEEFPAEFVYEAAPELRELAFLTTRVRNQRRQPYLQGPASVFLGSDFIGDGHVPTTARGEEFPVSLGADESVSVKRAPERKRETTGLFTSYHKYLHGVDVTVKNQKRRRVKVALFDRVPFSEDPKVAVARRAVTPPASVEERKGLLRWDLSLEPGEERKVSFSYTVELPADKALLGREDPQVKW